jgi:PASTA domain/Glucodextranase, domain B
MRPLTLLAAPCLAAALIAAGCGDGDDESRAARLPIVQMAVSAPSDLAVVREAHVTVKGTVAPARAEVRVLGTPAEVMGGRFTATVPLEPGANVIDVIAEASGREPAMTAVRVTREVTVTVPELVGASEGEARERLEEVGLKIDVLEEPGGFLDELLPGGASVCHQEPRPGQQVRRGTTVSVVISKGC